MIDKRYIRRAFKGLRALEQKPEGQQDMVLSYINGVFDGIGLINTHLLDWYPDREKCFRRLKRLMHDLVYSVYHGESPRRERALRIICRTLNASSLQITPISTQIPQTEVKK